MPRPHDRYCPHKGASNFKRSPPTSSSYRNRLRRKTHTTYDGVRPCNWDPTPLPDFLFWYWQFLSGPEKATWANEPTYPWCPLENRFTLFNRDRYLNLDGPSHAYPAAEADAKPSWNVFNVNGGDNTITYISNWPAEAHGWYWMIHRDLNPLFTPSYSTLTLLARFLGDHGYIETETEVPEGNWWCKLHACTHEGRLYQPATRRLATVT